MIKPNRDLDTFMTAYPDLEVDISLTVEDWPARIEGVEAICEAAARSGFEHALTGGVEHALTGGVEHPLTGGVVLAGAAAEVCIVLSTDDAVQALNREYRGLDKPTNVLSFSGLEEGASMAPPVQPEGAPVLLGDIIVALETVEREARQENKSLPHHLSHMIVHGMLHLLGYDHENEDEAVEMEALEVKALAMLGVENPYENGDPVQDHKTSGQGR